MSEEKLCEQCGERPVERDGMCHECIVTAEEQGYASYMDRIYEPPEWVGELEEWEYNRAKKKVVCQFCEDVGEVDETVITSDPNGWARHGYELPNGEFEEYYLCRKCDMVKHWEDYVPDTDDANLSVYRGRR